MIYTEQYYTQNNVETWAHSLNRGYFFYRLQVLYQKECLQSGAYLPMRMKLFLSLFENRSCVIDAVSGISKDSACLTVLCSSYIEPESFSASLRSVVPFVIVEQLTHEQAYRLLEQQLPQNCTISVAQQTHTALITAKELLLALLLEYRGLVCEAGISHHEETAALEQTVLQSAAHFYTPFLFYERGEETYAIPSFMVSRLESDNDGYNLVINDLWNHGKEFAAEIQFCKSVDIASLRLTGKKERGYYHAIENGSHEASETHRNRRFIVCIPSLINAESASQLDSHSDVSAPVFCHKVV